MITNLFVENIFIFVNLENDFLLHPVTKKCVRLQKIIILLEIGLPFHAKNVTGTTFQPVGAFDITSDLKWIIENQVVSR